MRDRYNNDYYDDEEGYVDEYREGEEQQEEVREPPKLTKEEKDFLCIREKLKEKFRRKLLKETGSTFGRSALHETPKTSSQDKFGSFFGPSLPGIAPRIIEEVKSFQENGYMHSSSKSSGSSTTKGVAPMSSRPKSSNGPKTVNEVKRKAEILKDNRDYMFLFSDDTEAPHNLSTKNVSQIKSVPSTSQPSSAKNNKEPSRGHLTGPNGISAPSSAKHIKEPSRGHLKGPNNSTTGTSTQRQSHQQHHRKGSTTTGTSTQRNSQQQIERQGTARQPLLQSKRPRPISNGSHRLSPSTGAKRPPFNDNAIDMIRKMFNYNPKRWAGVDEDDSDMEVGFDVIQKEERRSSKIGKKEDEEQLRLIEEEEKRERMRKRQKLR